MSIPTECCTKISELIRKNWHIDSLEKGTHEFYNGTKHKKNEIDFLGRKPINIVLENTKDAEKQHLGGNVF